MQDTQATRVLVGGAVITVDDQRHVFDPGAVAIRGAIIEEVGLRDDVLRHHPAVEQIDLRHTVMLPGLIDSHGHAGHGLTKGIADGYGGVWMSLMEEIYHRAADDEFWRAESYLSALERLEYGVTTSLSITGSTPRTDDARYAVAAASGYDALGLRHIVSLGPPGSPWPLMARDLAADTDIPVDLERSLETTAEVIRLLRGSGDGRIEVFVGPSGLVAELEDGRATDSAVRQLQGVLQLARDTDSRIHAHAFAGHIAAAAQAVPDILSPRLSLAHCAGISLEEVGILADTGVHVTHGPLTNAYVRARFPLIEALDAGVNVTLSTDGSSPDRSFDLLAVGRIAAQLQRAHFADTSLLPAGKLLEMMTIDAARLLGMQDRIGSLDPGKQADIVALDLRSARMAPRFMLLQRVVNVACGLDVEFVMVGGRILMNERTIPGVDAERIIEDANRAAESAYKRAGAERYLGLHPDTWRQVRYRNSSPDA
jgi:5-methylthioadenosine/S-adenosylhomocysteine deaminase